MLASYTFLTYRFQMKWHEYDRDKPPTALEVGNFSLAKNIHIYYFFHNLVVHFWLCSS